jgi:hypothetical protein
MIKTRASIDPEFRNIVLLRPRTHAACSRVENLCTFREYPVEILTTQKFLDVDHEWNRLGRPVDGAFAPAFA